MTNLTSLTWCGWPEIITPTVAKCGRKGEKKTRSIHVLKLDFIALNDCFWVTWHSWGEKMFKSITFYENRFGTRNSYPNRVGVSWGSLTPLPTWMLSTRHIRSWTCDIIQRINHHDNHTLSSISCQLVHFHRAKHHECLKQSMTWWTDEGMVNSGLNCFLSTFYHSSKQLCSNVTCSAFPILLNLFMTLTGSAVNFVSMIQ